MPGSHRIAAFFVACMLAGPSCAQPPPSVSITSPAGGAEVARRHIVAGWTSATGAAVWVVIHPLESPEYWVQPPAIADQNGSWKVVAIFGREGNVDSGKDYEIRAFVDLTGLLAEGQTLDWPKVAAESQLLQVVRN